ncbi:uncharacterized protein G2W53_007305 [Senna tora]|uniref:Uncharacterized protein n=1 Tax=Senna tora TaxID=362788 RepID=A0A834X550_9FABA|nr:uncharacterized protein G2W53_007305 [Senna tora]
MWDRVFCRHANINLSRRREDRRCGGAAAFDRDAAGDEASNVTLGDEAGVAAALGDEAGGADLGEATSEWLNERRERERVVRQNERGRGGVGRMVAAPVAMVVATKKEFDANASLEDSNTMTVATFEEACENSMLEGGSKRIRFVDFWVVVAILAKGGCRCRRRLGCKEELILDKGDKGREKV